MQTTFSTYTHAGAFLVLILCLTPEARAREFSSESIMEHVTFLASERLQGRPAGTRFEKMAAEYIVEKLARNPDPGLSLT